MCFKEKLFPSSFFDLNCFYLSASLAKEKKKVLMNIFKSSLSYEKEYYSCLFCFPSPSLTNFIIFLHHWRNQVGDGLQNWMEYFSTLPITEKFGLDFALSHCFLPLSIFVSRKTKKTFG
jgi:hypothetical protein